MSIVGFSNPWANWSDLKLKTLWTNMVLFFKEKSDLFLGVIHKLLYLTCYIYVTSRLLRVLKSHWIPNSVLAWLTEDVSPPVRQAIAIDDHIVDWDPGQCESKAPPRVPGVRVQRQAHDEEADHREGDRDHQGHLRVIKSSKQTALS